MNSLSRKYVLRRLMRSPSYALSIVISLSLAIGLNTAAFATLERIVLRPLPFADEDDLITVGKLARRIGATGAPSEPSWEISAHDLRAWRDSRSLEEVAVFAPEYQIIAGHNGAEYVHGAVASPNFAQVLRQHPLAGRWFTPDEERQHVVVISLSLAQRQYGGPVQALDKLLEIENDKWRIIGVFPNAQLPLDAEYWKPSDWSFGQVLARIRPSYSVSQVRQELELLSPGIANLRRAGYDARLLVYTLREQLFGSARRPLVLLVAATTLLLAIGCANAASLSLARTLERIREIAVRLTLGARRRELAGLVLAENAILLVGAVLIGLGVAILATRVLEVVTPSEFLRGRSIDISALGITFAAATALLACILVSIAPVMLVNDERIQSTIAQTGTRKWNSPRSGLIRRALTSAQIAVAVVLLTAAGLLIRTVETLGSTNHLGFRPEGVVVANLDLAGSELRDPRQRAALVRELIAGIQRLPLVESWSFGPPPLVAGRGEALREGFNALFTWRDRSQPDTKAATVWVKYVDPGYVQTYGLRIRNGRMFGRHDDSTAQRVALLSETAAKLFFQDRNALGQLLDLPALTAGGSSAPVVVGVIEDVLQRDVTLSANPEILLPIAQQRTAMLPTVAVRTTGSPRAMMGALRQLMRSIDPRLLATRLEPMSAVVDRSLARQRFLRLLLSTFAFLGVVLALVGLYAVISYLVSQRTTELGIRMAIGARPLDIVALIGWEATKLLGIGVVVGIAAALTFLQTMSAVFYGLAPYDFMTLLVTPGLLAVFAYAATLVPALRAARIDPAVALRTE